MERLLGLNRATNTHVGWLPVSLNQDVLQLWTQLALTASLALSSGMPAAQPLLDDIGERASRTWREAKALELVAGEVAGELREDPFHAEVTVAQPRLRRAGGGRWTPSSNGCCGDESLASAAAPG